MFPSATTTGAPIALGTATLNNQGIATLVTTAIQPGTRVLTATWLGDVQLQRPGSCSDGAVDCQHGHHGDHADSVACGSASGHGPEQHGYLFGNGDWRTVAHAALRHHHHSRWRRQCFEQRLRQLRPRLHADSGFGQHLGPASAPSFMTVRLATAAPVSIR